MVDWEFAIPYQQQYLLSKNSRKCTAHIHAVVDAMKSNSVFSVFNQMDHLLKLHRELYQEIEIQYQNLLKSVLPTFDDNKYNEELMERPQHG